MSSSRKTRLAFAIIKISVNRNPFYLMRINPKWRDVNFVGGHEKERDAHCLEMTARRELWEEVPAVRTYKRFDLETLSPELDYGPILSRSRGNEVEYEVQFFLFRTDESPNALVELLGSRSKNVWVSEHDLLSGERIRTSALVGLLNGYLPGGLSSISYSSSVDLGVAHAIKTNTNQFEFALK